MTSERTVRELLELAAKATGRSLDKYCWYGPPTNAFVLMCDGEPTVNWWNPLTDDGGALRLAVKLRIHISLHHDHVEARFFDGAAWHCFKERYGDDENAAIRRAIVRAAAEIARTQEQQK